MDEGVRYNEAANLEFRVSSFARMVNGAPTSSLPDEIRNDYEALSVLVGRIMNRCHEITASSCIECGKKTNVDLACDCFQTVAAE